jgi:hypothetical protein
VLTAHLPSECAIELPNSCQSEELHSGAPTTARSESYSEVHSERNRVCRRRAYWPTETHRQVRLDKVSLEQATVSVFDREAFVNQRRESPRRVIYVKGYSSSHCEAVSQTVDKTGVNRESCLPWFLCIYLWDKFEVEGQATATFDGDSNGKSNRECVCQIIGGLASGVRHHWQNETYMASQSWALLRLRLCLCLRLLLCLRQRYSSRQGCRQHYKYNPYSSPSPAHFLRCSPWSEVSFALCNVLVLVRFMPLVKRTKYGRVIPVRHGVAARALHWRRLGKKHRFAMRIADPASRRVRQLRFAL